VNDSADVPDGAPVAPAAPVGPQGEESLPEPHPLRSLLWLGLIVGGLLAVYLSPLHSLLLPSGMAPLREELDAIGALAPLAFGAGAALLVGIGAPRLWFAGAAGLLFGWWWGFVIAQVSTNVGCLLNFAWGRWLARDLLARRNAPRLQRLLGALDRAPVATNIAVRLCPVGNAFAFNLLLAASQVSARDFVVGTFLGTLPETLAVALFLDSAHSGSVGLLLSGAALMAALTAASLLIARSSARGRRG
jgi:uncharacterized membrane protein YdjX (TVP38/TMEM64 family)